MSIFEQIEIGCHNCEQTQNIEVKVSVDASTQPWIRESVLDREFHRFNCNSCGAHITVDSEFLYTDIIGDQQCFYSVKRHKKGYEFAAAGNELNKGLKAMVPDKYGKELYKPTKHLRRVVFGLDELREKLLAADAGLTDIHVELVKLKILRDHPVLLSMPRLRLRLEKISKQSAVYIARFDHGSDRFRISVPRKDFDLMSPDNKDVANWMNALSEDVNPVSGLEDGFVNTERLNPGNSALAQLQSYADEIDAGRVPDLVGPPSLSETLTSLPPPEHLPNWAMAAIQKVIAYADVQQLGLAIEDLFYAALRFRPEREWGDNAIFGDAENLFSLLEDLPDEHVQFNTRLDRIDITQAGSWYDADSDVIGIGESKIGQKQLLKDYLYHEIGHSVHYFFDEKENELVTRWLEDDVGFLYFGDYYGGRPPNDIEIDAWVTMMGGYKELNDYQQSQCREVIKDILRPYIDDGTGNYLNIRPPLPDTVVAGHPFDDTDFGPRSTYDKCPNRWWLNASNWHRSKHNGEDWAFAFHYAYKHLMAVKVSAITRHLELLKYRDEDIDGAYAYNSPWEFFAEIYRVYYDPAIDPARLDDDTKQSIYGMLGAPEQSNLE